MKKLVMIFAVLVMAMPVCAEEVLEWCCAGEVPPMHWKENDQMKGYLVDTMTEAFRRLGEYKLSLEYRPWERCQHLAKSGNVDILTTNGPLRKEWAEYSNETVVMWEFKLYAKAGGPKLEQLKKVKNIEDLRPFKLLTHRGNAWHKAELVDKGFNTHDVTDYEQLFLLLVKGRGDAFVENPCTIMDTIERQGLKDQIVEVATILSLPMHLVIAKGSPLVKIIPEFDKILRQMKDDGTVQKFYDKYNFPLPEGMK